MLGADLDVAVAAGAAVELAGDAADQPGLVALFGQAAQAPADARQPSRRGPRHTSSTARRSRRPSPGWRRRRGAGRAWRRPADRRRARPRARRWRSRCRAARPAPTSRAARRGRSATAWAAAKVSQIGPQRRKRCSASGEGSSWPSTRRVAAGATIAPLPRTRSKAIMLRLVRRSACSSVIARTHPTRCGRERRAGPAKWTAVTKTATKIPPAQEPLRVHPGALRRVLALPEGRRPLHRRPSRRGGLPDRRGAGPASEHLVIDGGALLPGPRLRGLPRASAGRDRGVPHDDRRRQRRRQRRRALLLRPLRARGLARRRLREPRGNRAQADPRAGRRLGRRARRPRSAS